MSRRQPHSKGVPRIQPNSPRKNIVVFGESGVGKSSLINLIAGRSIAHTSSDVKGCTFRHTKYELQVDDTPYAIWDTAGLDEGTYGTVPAKTAEKQLKKLLRDLRRANGVHLLVYCIRASRLRRTLLNSYNLFYSAICRKKVPIVAVVTGLEYHEREMEDWWTANEAELGMLKMHFDGHACVTTLNVDKVNSPILKERCRASRQVVLSLIASACAHDLWRTKQDGWASAALADVRAMLKPNRIQPPPIVALYDMSGYSPDSVGSAKGTPPPFEGGHLMDVGGSPLLVHHICDRQLHAGTRFRKRVSTRGADLLVLCTSIHSNRGVSRRHAAAFYDSYGGDTRPLLVVVRDAPSDESAREWWNAPEDDYHDHKLNNNGDDAVKLHATVRALPPPESSVEGRHVAIVRLRRTIQTRALQPVDVMPTGCFRWLTGRRHLARMSTDATLARDTLTTCEVWAPMHRL